MITETNMFKQFNKLLDCSTIGIDKDTKRIYKLAYKVDKTTEIRRGRREEVVEEQEAS